MPSEGSPLQGLFGDLMKDPALLEGILSAAGSLLSLGKDADGGEGDTAADGEGEADKGRGASQAGAEREKREDPSAKRKHLLLALKPYLSPERREKVDTILAMMGMLDVAASAGLLGKGEGKE